MQKRDYFERMIEQIAAAVTKIAGLARDAKLDEAETELDAAWSAGLNFKRRDADRLDDATLKMLLGPKATLVASLFDAEAAIEDARGGAARAAKLRARAVSLRPSPPPSSA
ncbi:MAG TPA: hypothetical protein VF316_19910 [Polyangiaceae bacterium]